LHRRTSQPEPPRAQPHLISRFLARDIGHGLSRACNPGSRLKQQSRFADAGITGHQHRRARYKPAAQRPIKLCYTSGEPGRKGHITIQTSQRKRTTATRQIMLCTKRSDGPTSVFGNAIPFPTFAALPRPPGRD
jgi:hypothetical protein